MELHQTNRSISRIIDDRYTESELFMLAAAEFFADSDKEVSQSLFIRAEHLRRFKVRALEIINR